MFGVSRHRFLAYQTLAEGIANAALSLLLVRSYGLVGVALAAAIPMIICKLFVQPVYVCRQSGISLKDYYFDLFGRSVLVPGLAMVIPWGVLFMRVVRPSLFSLGFVISVQLILGMALSYFFLFDRDEREAIVGTLLGRRKKTEPLPRCGAGTPARVADERVRVTV